MVATSKRLQHIPEWARHQHVFCFWLHDLMVDVMRQADAARVSHVHFRFASEEQARAFSAAHDPITFFSDNGHTDMAQRIAINQSVIPLYGDMLHFIYEGLRALEKRKYTVALNLFRKPFKYGLLFVTWMFADEDDFFRRLRHEPADSFDERKISPEKRRELLTTAIAALEYNEFLDADVIYGMAFDRNNARGLAQYFDKAAHLVTSHPAMRTENLNLNLIFKNPSDTDIYDNIYYILAYLLRYLLCLQIATIGRMAEVPEWYKKWAAISTMSLHESLFVPNSSMMLDHVVEVWGEMLTCPLCKAPLEVTRGNALNFFMYERVECQRCKADQQFPLFWIMSKFVGGEPESHEAAPT